MTSVVNFSPELSRWISQHLDLGYTPAALIDVMQQQQMEALAADAIMRAFVSARRSGRAVPVDRVIIDDAGVPVDAFSDALTDYRYEQPLLAAGNRIQTSDRSIQVAGRAPRPHLALLSHVMSADECEQLIALAKPRLKPSTIVDPLSGKDIVSEKRSSYGMFFRLHETPLVSKLDTRIAEIMNLPVENGEGIQILYYPQGAGSEPHFDYLQATNPANQASIARSGQRCSTLVCYLNQVDAGGETVFPETGWAVTPVRGNAVYFEYANSLGQTDPASLHASNPVIAGEKWVATKWMRQKKFVSA